MHLINNHLLSTLAREYLPTNDLLHGKMIKATVQSKEPTITSLGS
jgi:hypothetical protein